jgi:hypothetical protein
MNKSIDSGVTTIFTLLGHSFCSERCRWNRHAD